MKKWLILRRIVQFVILLTVTSPVWIPLILGLKTRSGYYTGVFSGTTATSNLFGFPLSDPLTTLQVVVAGQMVTTALLTGLLLIVAFYWLIGGRTFCSWICPVNMVLEIGDKIRTRLPVGDQKFGLHHRYTILAAIIVISALVALPVYEIFGPVPVLWRGLIYGFGLEILLLAGIVLFEMFVARRGWCRAFCPQGAVYGFIGRLSPVGVKINQDKCTHCLICRNRCPAGEELLTQTITQGGTSPDPMECTNCGNCIDDCGPGAIGFGFKGPTLTSGFPSNKNKGVQG